MKRELPVLTIHGTDFIVDVMKEALIQVENGNNTIPFNEMLYMGNGYGFSYDPKEKNLPGIMSSPFVDVVIPPLVQLDPEGLAIKYKTKMEAIKGKTDFEIMVDQELYQRRLNGQLPVIEIMDHPFFVDVRMDSLRPKDDFSTAGIVYSEIDNYILPDDRRYWIPYDPASHSVREIDVENIIAIPNDIFVMEIPTLEKLDPVGYARQHGFNVEQMVMANPIEQNMVAKNISWKETGLQEIIEKNMAQRRSDNIKSEFNQSTKKSPRQHRGNRL